MSDYISIEIQAEIMKRLPVKSLIRFRLVSKPWKTLIESSEFISDYYRHNIHQKHNHHLLIRYTDSDDYDETKFDDSEKAKFVSVVDNHTFPVHKYSIPVPVSIKSINSPKIVVSKGLFCIYNFYPETVTGKKKAIIWNPLINKSIDIEFPIMLDWPHETVVGFSVCPKTGDIKLVGITYTCYDVDLDNIRTDPWEVNVFTLSSGVWRRPLCANLPRHTIELTMNQVGNDRYLYWNACDTDDDLERFTSIIMFDTITEEFTELCLPDRLAREIYPDIVISKLRESLVVFHYKTNEAEKEFCKVLMMEHGDPISFTNLFTINITDTSIERVLGYRMSGELVIVMKKNDSSDHEDALFVYEPYSKKISDVDISAKKFSFYASSYTESLLLLDK